MPADALIALNEVAAARLAAQRAEGFSRRRLRNWENLGIVRPSVTRRDRGRSSIRLYDFDALMELSVAAELIRGGAHTRRLREAVALLRAEGHAAPLRQLRFAVESGDVFFQRLDGTSVDSHRPAEYVIPETLNLEEIRDAIRAAVWQRSAEKAGEIEQRRGVLGNKPRFAGTRIPLAAVRPYLERHLPDSDILTAFPDLTPADLSAARARPSQIPLGARGDASETLARLRSRRRCRRAGGKRHPRRRTRCQPGEGGRSRRS